MPTKILAIDDSKTMRLAIKITFAAEDAKVTAVSKGSEAVARAKQMQADVVLVDHKLAAGEPSGFEVVQALKANPATANIPVIMLVPARGGVSEADIKAAGADNYIGKPFDTQELIDKVAASLGRSAQSGVPAPSVRPVAPPTTTKPVGPPPGSKPGVKPVGPKPVGPKPVAPPLTGPKTPSVATPPTTGPKPPVGKPVGTKPSSPLGAKPTGPGARPVATPAAAATKPAAASSAGPATIPIAVPIPFTAASSPTPGMLERIKAAAGSNGAVAGLDPKVAQAILQLSQEVLEQVAWEVVPDLAEELIKQKVR